MSTQFTKQLYSRKHTLDYLTYLKKFKSIQGNTNDWNRITNQIKKLIDTKMHLL